MPRIRKRKSDPSPPPTAIVLSGTLSTASARHGEPQLLIAVKCPHCRSQHVHTWAVGETGPHHRVAHCAAGSALRLTGYFVECEDTPYNAAVLRQYGRLRAQWEASGAPLAEVVEVLHR